MEKLYYSPKNDTAEPLSTESNTPCTNDNALIEHIDPLQLPKEKQRRMSNASIWLFVLSIASLFISLLILVIYSDIIDPVPFTKGWLFIVTVPIPIASLIFGFCARKNGRCFLKNIIVGIIVTFLTILYTVMFAILCVDDATHDDAAVLRVEQAMSIDIPSHEYISTTTITATPENALRVYERYESKVYFDEKTAEKFKAELLSDGRWLKDKSPNDLLGLMKMVQYDNSERYNTLFNVTTGEFNCTPDKDGRYEFIQLVYDTTQNILYIYEYVLEYHK